MKALGTQQQMEAAPADVALTCRRIAALHLHKSEFDSAQSYFERALQLTPVPDHGPASTATLDALDGRARVCEAKQDDDAAAAVYQQLLTLVDESGQCTWLGRLAALHLRAGRGQQALDCADRMITLLPGDGCIRCNDMLTCDS